MPTSREHDEPAHDVGARGRCDAESRRCDAEPRRFAAEPERSALGPSLGSFAARLQRQASSNSASVASHRSAAHLAAGASPRVEVPGFRVFDEWDRANDACPAPQAAREALAALGFTGTPVFFDLETTGLWGASTPTIALAGLAWPRGAQWRVKQWSLRKPEAERAMLDATLTCLQAELPSDAVLITYNGLSFDSPLLKARSVRLGLSAQELLCDLPHLDLLLVVRGLGPCMGSLPDCRLSTLERELLGLVRVDELSGAEVAQAYRRALAAPHDAWTVRQVELAELHNRCDLVGLVRLLPLVAERWRRDDDATAQRVAHMLCRRGQHDEARARLQRAWDARPRPAGTDAELEVALLLAELHRKHGAPELAHALWRLVCRTRRGHPKAHEALAKDLEHRLRRPAEALEVACASAQPCPRRIERLQRKAAQT